MQEPEGSFSSSVGWTLPGFQIGKNSISWMGNLGTTGKNRYFCFFTNCTVFVRLNAEWADKKVWFSWAEPIWRMFNVLLWANKGSERVRALQSALEWPRLVADQTLISTPTYEWTCWGCLRTASHGKNSGVRSCSRRRVEYSTMVWLHNCSLRCWLRLRTSRKACDTRTSRVHASASQMREPAGPDVNGDWFSLGKIRKKVVANQ